MVKIDRDASFEKGGISNPRVGDKLFLIPYNSLFIVPVEVECVQSKCNWSTECIYVDEPTGHSITAWDCGGRWLYRTLAAAKSGLRSRILAQKDGMCKYKFKTLKAYRTSFCKDLKCSTSAYAKKKEFRYT